MKQIRKYTNHAAMTAPPAIYSHTVSLCEQEEHIHYDNYEWMYLTIESEEDDNDIMFTKVGSIATKTIYVSIDDGVTWTEKTSSTEGTLLASLDTKEKVLLKGTNNAYGSNNDSRYNNITGTKNHKVYGNVMSLRYGDNFIGESDVANLFISHLFFHDTTLTDAYNVIIPSASSEKCCYGMFNGCTSLVMAPKILPATTLGASCYQCMFQYCSSLKVIPKVLPATTLATTCYQYMFHGCGGITVAPELPAETLVNYCYGYMFYLCSNLNYIKCLATNISATNPLTAWVYKVKATGTFVKNANMADWTFATNGIPTGWTVIDAS